MTQFQRMRRHEKAVLCAAAALWFIVCVFPLYNMVCVTFSTDTSDMMRTFFPNSLSNGVEKIKAALFLENILRSSLTSLLITVITITGMLLICSLAAYEFAFYNFPFKKPLFAAVMGSMMLPFVLYVIPLYRFIVTIKLSDTVIGIALPLMVSALSVFIIKQFLEDVPLSLIESGRIDGAGHFRIFFSIVLPLMRNAIITVTVLMFLSVWGAYLWPSLVSGEKVRPISVAIANLLSPQFWTDPRVKIAAMLVSSITPLAIFFIFQKYVIDGISASGVKG